ncbi:DNA internalization-related competence protein ComEC/Rec2 [Lactobacillus sp. YT155]|uniref:DNA internalization-related competence protein ComEC/Rec2 n=1 Tax=Lactobacillus sp. YT155 TaxID=3060955 RepID=UPI00265E62B8|nr:DNA internalization-related competence protein ComEC/Rec2 [Lactobacillus sp. YT155]MDO1605309.1 DNA internalization-related competence protein ComEC/Rec2 [Lactobacillus sp. YT155]
MLLIVTGAVLLFSIRMQFMPKHLNTDYQQLTLKIEPSEFQDSGDYYTGIAQSNQEKFSFIIPKTKNRIHLSSTQNTYLQTTDFELEGIKGPTNFAETNFQKYFFAKNIYRRLKINSFKQGYDNPTNFAEWLSLLRYRLEKRLQKLPPTLRFNALSLLLGAKENDEQTKAYLNDFSKLGIIHLFSLSGMHLLLIIGFLRKLCSWTRVCTIETLESFLFALLPIYCILVGSKTSITRATILVLVKIGFSKLKIRKSSTEIFAISLLIGLIIDPKCLLLLGGQLTYLLSFALVYLHRLSIFKLSIVINLLCLPLIIFNNFEINLATFVVNILIAPVFEYFILPSTIFVGIFGNSMPSINRILEFTNRTIYSICHQISRIQFLQLATGKFLLLTVILLLCCGLVYISDSRYKKKCCQWFVIIFCLNLLMNKIPLTGQVTLIDVGQGDSILITTPILRKTFLIDTGGKLHFGHQRVINYNVDKATIPYLKSLGIGHIDAVFLSHQDSDHIGDLKPLLEHFPVRRVYFGIGMEHNPKIKKVLLPFVNQVAMKTVRAGDVLNFGNFQFEVLAPFKPGIGENEDSMVLKTTINHKSWLFTGDLPRDKELEVVKKFHPQIDYLKVGHHGSKTASDPDFIRAIHPQIAFISVGRKNRYGHPNKETIETLEKQQVKILKTSEYGMIKWNYWFNDYNIETFLRK